MPIIRIEERPDGRWLVIDMGEGRISEVPCPELLAIADEWAANEAIDYVIAGLIAETVPRPVWATPKSDLLREYAEQQGLTVVEIGLA